MRYPILLDSFGDLLNIAPPLMPSREIVETMLKGLQKHNGATSIKGDFELVGDQLSGALQKY